MRKTGSVLVLLLVVLAGCMTDGDPSSEEGPPELHYEAQGPLLIPGFWPTADGEYIEADGSTNLTVRLTDGRVVAGPSGSPVPALNLTYRYGGEAVTHWVHPAGRIVVTEQTQDAFEHRRWWWDASGMPALVGEWRTLAAGEPPASIEVRCCPDEPVFGKDTDEALRLHLEEAQGSAVSIPGLDEGAASWSPPRPTAGERFPWDHHPPEPSSSRLDFPLSEAIEEYRGCSSRFDEFLQAHEAWELSQGVYIQGNPGLVPSSATEELRWTLQITTEDGDGISGEVVKEHPPEAPIDRAVYRCESPQEGSEGSTYSGRKPDLLPYERGWATAEEVVRPDDPFSWSTGRTNRVNGPIFQAALQFDPVSVEGRPHDSEFRILSIDIETGLNAWYFGPEPPLERFSTGDR